MITTQEIQNEIDDLIFKFNRKDVEKKEKKQAQLRVRYLKSIAMYLASDPSEKFVMSEYEKAINRMELLEQAFSHYSIMYKGTMSEVKKNWESENDIPKLRKQIKNLIFILQIKK